MKRFSLALALGAAILALACPRPSRAEPCSFDHHIGFWTTFEPPQPCPGQPVSLVVHDCSECDHVFSGAFGDQGVFLQFLSQQICPLTIVCQPESLVIPLGTFAAGMHTITIFSHATVITNPIDSTFCDVNQQDQVTFTVADSCPPVPPQPGLPFVTSVQVGTPSPCLACLPVICPGDSIPVRIHMVFPDLCFDLAGVDILSQVGGSFPPQPSAIRLTVDACLQCPCALVFHERDVVVKLPPLSLGTYSLPIFEVWRDHQDPQKIDSTFAAQFPFSVTDACSSSTPGCFITGWEHQAGGCDAFVDSGHPAVATMDIHTNAPLAGLQGTLALYPPGLVITQLEPVGPAATWKVVWEPVPGGGKYTMFSVDGSEIPVIAGSLPILRATVAMAGGEPPAPVTYLSSGQELGSDPNAHQVFPCPILRIVNPAARICFGGQTCDLNLDGVQDIRDLVLMVHCVFGYGFCPDSSLARLDCNHDGQKSLDDVICCAGEVLHGRLPDSTARRSEPSVQVRLGTPRSTAAGVDIPLTIQGVSLLGAARLGLRFPSDRFTFASVDAANASWLALGQADGGDLTLGLIGLIVATNARTLLEPLEVTIHLALRPGQSAGGELRLANGDFSGPDGVALDVGFAPAVLPIDGARTMLAPPQPNPFSRETRFSVTLPGPGSLVEVTVHDLAGRRVATLFPLGPVIGAPTAATLPLRWSGTDDSGARVRDGVYFVHVRAGGSRVTQKIILVRGN